MGGVDLFDPDITLMDALWLKGGGLNAFARHAVAALLNASCSDVDYAYSVSGVICKVRDAASSGNYEDAKDDFEWENEEGCPLY